MGNPVQEIFQRRGDKKRQDIWIKRIFPFLLLTLTYIGLLLEFPSRKVILWFALSIVTIVIYAVLHFYKREKKNSLEFLFSTAILIEGIGQAFHLQWFRLIYFPFMVSLVAFYRLRTIIYILILLPLLEFNIFIKSNSPERDILFFAFLATTVIVTQIVTTRIKGFNKARSSQMSNNMLSQGSDYDAIIDSFNDEKLISYYLESMFDPDSEIKELLRVLKTTIFADSATLFVNTDKGLKVRCSTEEIEEIIISEGGIIQLCMQKRMPIVSYDIIERRIETGYLKKEKISSLVAIPLMDGNFPLGVLAADSARYHAFSSADSEILQTFSNQIIKILQRERVYPQIRRSYSALKVLNEESAKLRASLDYFFIVRSLIDGVYRIVPSKVGFFKVKGNEIEIVHQHGFPSFETNVFNIRHTVLNTIIKNKEPFYLSDIKNYRSPIFPFKVYDIGSLFILPMLYEKKILGILVVLSEEINAINPYQIELMKVLGNQAATSLANAQFHEEIKRLAITDGLTGIFNHRYFQEKLEQEFNRIDRFPEAISLLIIDIDNFKEINDTYGHTVGDFVLKGVSNIIKKTIRNIDIPSRYGGEEFTVILIGTDAKGAIKMAERLRKSVMKKSFSAENNTFHVTISIGISTYPNGIGGKDDLIETADKALYYAKKRGKNCCVLWKDIKNQF